MHILFVLLLAVAQAQLEVLSPGSPPQPPPTVTGTSSIEGTVVNDATGEPVKKAQVRLLGAVSEKQPVAMTDASGSFAFHKLPAGTYVVNAMHDGFDQNRALLLGDAQKQVTLTDDQAKNGVELRLPPTGAISGRITDENGDPAPNCSVGALDASTLDSFPWQQQGGRQAQTDDRGEYRISNLPAGRYIVYQHCQRGIAAPHGFMERGDPQTPVWAWVPGVYGGADEGAGASALRVHSGEEIRGIDFHLKITNAFHVSVTVVPDDPNVNLQNMWVRLEARDPAMARVLQYGMGRQNNSAEFHATPVVPGSYIAIADIQLPNKHWHGEEPVEVRDVPPQPVKLSLTSAMTVSGDLETEDIATTGTNTNTSGGDDPPSRPQATVSLIPLKTSFNGGIPQTQPTDDKGNFSITGVLPGRYQLQVIGATNSIKSVTLAGRGVSPSAIDLGPGATGPLHVVISMKQVPVQVSVNNLRQDQQTWVFLLPKGATSPYPGLNPTMASADQSPVSMQAPPGEYTAYAMECTQPWPLLNNPSVLRAIAAMGKAIEVKEDMNATATLSVIAREDLKRALDQDVP
jgi:protocatechuate 3,4-dioxygenase beta subunit